MRNMRVLSILLSVVLLQVSYAQTCPANGLALTPPMGWNSWNAFGLQKKAITAEVVEGEADAMVSSGMAAAGYTYVNIDDGWQDEQRDSHGNIQPNPTYFPNGMPPVVEYVHSKGLKIGIYSSPAVKTCAGNMGSKGHVQQDANTFASWGMDFLKYDWCNGAQNGQSMQQQFAAMCNALEATGRPMVYSLSLIGQLQDWTWGESVGGNMWRVTLDVKADYFRMAEQGFINNGLGAYAGPGHWNDADMLQIGNPGGTNQTGMLCTTPKTAEALGYCHTQMGLWAILSSPLIAGNDLRNMNATVKSILTNPYIIAVDQDASSSPGTRVWQLGPQEIWARQMSDGTTTVGVFNHVSGSAPVPLPFGLIGVSGQVDAINMWSGKDLGSISDGYVANVPPFDVVMLKLTPQKHK
jgi:alpha-galactosidase